MEQEHFEFRDFRCWDPRTFVLVVCGDGVADPLMLFVFRDKGLQRL